MKKRTRVVLTVCAVLALAVIAAVCLPFTRKIDTTLTAVEYRFDDLDYAVEHTVTIQGLHGSFDPETARFLVSGPAGRDAVLARAPDCSHGTALEPVFSNR